MQRFFLNGAKVWHMIRQDGLVQSLKHVTTFGRILLHRVGRGEILIITAGIGDSAMYRGRHVAEELTLHGFIAETTSQNNPFLLRYIKRFDLFVLHRVQCTAGMRRFISVAKEAGKTVLFETDDFTFDARAFAQTDTYAQMNAIEQSQYRQGQSHCVVNDGEVTHATVSTPFLANLLRKRGKDVFVVPNKLSQHDVALAEKILSSAHKHRSNTMVTIGYFAGSASHNRDFASVRDPLLKLLATYPQLHLLLVGPLTLDPVFDTYRQQITHKPYVPRAEYFALIARCDIVIAPLEVGNDFCEAKSAIKYLEAGLLGVPVVASATAEFQSVIDDGRTGFVVRDMDEWHDKLSALIADTSLRTALGQGARTQILARHTTACDGNTQYYTFLRQQLQGSSTEHLEPLEDCAPDIDTVVIIANWNGKKYLQKCLASLRLQDDQHFHTLVVDNGSTDGSLAMIMAHYPDVSWIALPHNSGFAHANNVGIRAACIKKHLQYIITLNNDTELDTHYIATMRSTIKKAPHAVGALQPKLLNYYDQNILDATGVITAWEMSALNRGRGEKDCGQYDDQREIFGPSASAALYRRDVLEDVRLAQDGFFDRTYFAYYEDVDLAWRLVHAGYHAQYVPGAIVYHVHSATGKNHSPFKAFHIHRNHYYNIIKNAPLFFLVGIMFFMPMRYVLLLVSAFLRRGAAGALAQSRAERAQETAHSDALHRIVWRSWRDVLGALPTLLHKRHIIMRESFWSAHKRFFTIVRLHHATLKKIIFGP